MFGPTLFEIPVYRLSLEEWTRERDQKWAHELASMRRDPDRDAAPLPESLINTLHIEFDEKFGPWSYRGVIGWIRLVAHFNDIIAHAWTLPAKRLSHDVPKTFVYWKRLVPR
jgi:hypothetical protein